MIDTHKRCLILTTSSTAQLAERSAFIWLSSHSSVQVPQVNQFVFYYSLGLTKAWFYLLPLAYPTTTKEDGFYLLPADFEHGEVHYYLKPPGAGFTALVKVF